MVLIAVIVWPRTYVNVQQDDANSDECQCHAEPPTAAAVLIHPLHHHPCLNLCGVSGMLLHHQELM
jgi:hypothetical protein